MAIGGRLLPLLTLLAISRVSVTQLVHDTDNIPSKPVPKIAVIGGGIGGTAAAYFLHELFGDDLLIDLYEPGHIGGRLATVPIAGHQYEVGGSVIHPSNQYMSNFVAQLGLSRTIHCPRTMGLFNGEDYVFTSSNVWLVDVIKQFMRYGLDTYRLPKVIAAVMQDFVKIYRLQEEGHAFKDVASMLSALSKEMLRMTQVSTFDWLTEHGLNPLTINELVMGVLQCNYGQTPTVHSLLGLTSQAATDDKMWSVAGGNKRVAEELLKHSRASLLRRRVTYVAPSTDSLGRFTVMSLEVEEPENTLLTDAEVDVAAAAATTTKTTAKDTTEESEVIHRGQEYDAVILATPLTHDKSKIHLANFTQQFSFPGHFEPIYATMVQGILQPESVMLSDDEMLDDIFLTNPRLLFNSFERKRPVDAKNCDQEAVGVWRIFSSQKIPEDQLDIFFQRRKSTHVVSWLAYPHYSTNQTLGDFELAPGLYHLNAIEWAGSAMEMSVIGAKNVALLAYKYYRNDPNAGRKPPVKEEL